MKIELDCGDNRCYFAVEKGSMRTNGGCRCFANAGFSRGMHAAARDMLFEVLNLRARVAELEKQLREVDYDDGVD